MSSDGWVSLPGDRIMKQHSGFVVIEPREHPPAVPLFCPVCDLMMRTDDDARKWRELGCCHRCGLAWADANREKWVSGWRPSDAQVEAEVSRRRAAPLGVKLEVI